MHSSATPTVIGLDGAVQTLRDGAHREREVLECVSDCPIFA